MIKLLFIASIFFTYNFSQAQSFKVIKLSGKKAIVEVNDPTLISVNQTYNVGETTSAPAVGKGGKRENALAMNFSFINQTSPSVSLMTLSGNYLWNFKTYEVGPVLSLTNSSGGGVSTSTTEIGALGFYNFNPHKPGTETIFSILGQLTIGSGSGNSSTNISIGPNYKWFLLSSDHCFSFSALYKMSQASGTTVSGFLLTAGISTYF